MPSSETSRGAGREAGPERSWVRPGRLGGLILISPRTIVLLAVILATPACLVNPSSNLDHARPRKSINAQTGTVRSLEFHADGEMLASVGVDGSIILWDMKARYELSSRSVWPAPIRCALFSPDRRFLAAIEMAGGVVLHDLVNHRSARIGEPSESGMVATTLAFAPDGASLAVGGQDGRIVFWDPTTGRVRSTLGRQAAYMAALAFAPDGASLAASSGDRTLSVWDVAAKRQRFVVRGHHGTVVSLFYSADGRYLISSDQVTPVVRIWNADNGTEFGELGGLSANVMTACLSPDGACLAAGDYSGRITFWDLSSRRIRPRHLHHAGVRALAFAHDGRTLASGGFDGTIHLWDWPRDEDD
jgi:WD40 repeat protein